MKAVNYIGGKVGIVGQVLEKPVLELDEGFDVVYDVGGAVEFLDGCHNLDKIVGELLVLGILLGIVDGLPCNAKKLAGELVAGDALGIAQFLPTVGVDPTAEGLTGNAYELEDAVGRYAAEVECLRGLFFLCVSCHILHFCLQKC